MPDIQMLTTAAHPENGVHEAQKKYSVSDEIAKEYYEGKACKFVHESDRVRLCPTDAEKAAAEKKVAVVEKAAGKGGPENAAQR